MYPCISHVYPMYIPYGFSHVFILPGYRMMVVSHGCKLAAHPSSSVVTDFFFTLNGGMHRAEKYVFAGYLRLAMDFCRNASQHRLMIKPTGSWMNTPAGKLLKTMVAKP